MKKNILIKISGIIVVVFCLNIVSVHSASFTKDDVGTTGGVFMKIGKGVKAIGMGEAYTGMSGQIDSIHWNPAGIASLKHPEISAMHSIWFEDIFYDNVSFAYPTKNGIFALSANYLGIGKINKYLNTGVSAGDSYSPYDILGSLTYANSFGRHQLGINLKYIYSEIEDESASAVAADLGYLTKLSGGKVGFGTSVQNLGTQMKYIDESDPLPILIKAGVSYDIYNRLILTFDANMPVDNEAYGNIGAEYNYVLGNAGFAVRSGYKTSTINDHDALSGLSAGMGINYFGLCMDYAWVPYGNLGNTHRMSMSYKFSEVKHEKSVRKKKKKAKVKKDKKAKKQVMTPAEILELKKTYFMKGHALFAGKKYQDSITEFNKVLELDPDHTETHKYIKKANQLKESQPEIQEPLDNNGLIELKKEFFMKGHALFAQKKYQEAIAEFQKVLDFDPDHGKSKSYIRRAEEELGY
jgi:hypothetical protein